ncbi:MAG: hypothetical protein NT014_07590 [Candidatus Omnitrophica bacterium]|nr:hypothetical protein [Candidatus Omnitrophota bacterium]
MHRDEYLNSGLVGDLSELERIPKNSNLKLIRTFPEQVCLEENIMCVQNSGAVDVYEITASVPLEPKAKRDNETVR